MRTVRTVCIEPLGASLYLNVSQRYTNPTDAWRCDYSEVYERKKGYTTQCFVLSPLWHISRTSFILFYHFFVLFFFLFFFHSFSFLPFLYSFFLSLFLSLFDDGKRVCSKSRQEHLSNIVCPGCRRNFNTLTHDEHVIATKKPVIWFPLTKNKDEKPNDNKANRCLKTKVILG